MAFVRVLPMVCENTGTSTLHNSSWFQLAISQFEKGDFWGHDTSCEPLLPPCRKDAGRILCDQDDVRGIFKADGAKDTKTARAPILGPPPLSTVSL